MKKTYITPSAAIAELEGQEVLLTLSGESSPASHDLENYGNDRDDYDDEEDLW